MVLFLIQIFVIQCVFYIYISVQTSHFSGAHQSQVMLYWTHRSGGFEPSTFYFSELVRDTQ